MHILIITDFEGISGIDKYEMLDENGPCYRKSQELLMADVNAAVSGALEGGADKVSVVDGHHHGKNFIEGALDKRAVQLPAADFSAQIMRESDYDAAFAIGAHAMAGTQNAFIDHTQSSIRWFEYRINGVPYGELGQQAVTFGMADIPLVMVSGDKAACVEAENMIKGIVTANVKTGKNWSTAECIDTEEAHKMIFEAAKAAISKIKDIEPYKVSLPARIELTLCRNVYCDEMMLYHPEYERNGRTVARTVNAINCYRDVGI